MIGIPKSLTSSIDNPAMAVATGFATASPPSPTIAVATGRDEATPPMPAIARPERMFLIKFDYC